MTTFIAIYNNVIFWIVTFYCWIAISRNIVLNSKRCALLLTLLVSALIAFCPIPWGSGGDRELYVSSIEVIRSFGDEALSKDKLFSIYNNIVAQFVGYQGWLIITALIYSFNHYRFVRQATPNYVLLGVLMFFSAFLFYSYGINTIRSGFAASFLLLAFANWQNLWLMGLFIIIAVGCHLSMAIPAIAFLITRYFNKTKLYFAIWFLSIVLSAAMGSAFETIFSGLGGDSRVAYLNKDAADTAYKVGFRLDFIIYSCIPVFAGYYYIVKKGFKDRFYSILYNTYLIANSFWILVIRANFSDRFAYLSWFIYPIVLIYPLLKERLVINQNRKIIMIVFFHTLFTYIMFLR